MDSEDRSTQKDTSSSAGASSLSDLIARLRQSTGPDRELDAHIAASVGLPMTFCDFDAGCYHGGCRSPGCGKPLGLTDERRSYPHDWRDDERLPRYTSSIDAAMTLVPEGWRVNSGDFSVEGRFAWMLTLAGQPRTEWFARRRSMTDDYDGDPLYMSGRGKTLSIALCIAALKARSLPAI